MCCIRDLCFPHIVLDMTVDFILWICVRNVFKCLIVAIVLIRRKLTRYYCYLDSFEVSG